MKKLKLIDLFAGAGGLSCGLEMAGFTPVLANELVPQPEELDSSIKKILGVL